MRSGKVNFKASKMQRGLVFLSAPLLTVRSLITEPSFRAS